MNQTIDVVEWLQERAFRMYGPTMEAAHTKTKEWLWADEITRLRADLTAALAECERLIKSRNRWGKKYNDCLGKLRLAVMSDSDYVKEIDYQNTRLRAENERLREALRPFAVGQKVIHRWYSSDIFPDVPDDHPVLSNKITVGDLRRARAALEGVTEPASPWRDIESAPKDGTKFLAWFTWPGRHSVEMARWESNQFAKQPKPYWTCDNERLHGIIATRAAQPTHWMPLPEPPR